MIAYRLARLAARVLVRLVWRTHVTGVENVPRGAVVVVANHESLLDPLFLSAAIPRPLRYLAKEELFKGAAGPLLRGLGGIPVGRGRGDRAAVGAGAATLERGDAIAVFPQGTVLGAPGRPWYRGAARLALSTGAPILPVRLVGTRRALEPRTRRVGFPRVHVLVGEPLPVEREEPTVAQARALTECVRDAVESLWVEHGAT